MVIVRNSSFTYKGRAVDVRQVGRELGVRYLLEGSVLRADQRIRVTAQLVETTSGEHRWAERFDRQLRDLFAVLDEITLKVVTELQVLLTIGDHARIIAHGTESIEALESQLQARALFMRFDRESNLRARELSREASMLDPLFAWALAQEGWTHYVDLQFRRSEDPAGSLQTAEALARRALAADANSQFALTLLSRVYAWKGQLDEAIAEGRRAVAVSPNDSYPISLLARLLMWAGQPEEAVALIRKALRLQPYPESIMLSFAGDAHFFSGHYEEAATWYRRFLEREGTGTLVLDVWQYLIASYMHLGRSEQARTEVRRLLEAHPDFSVSIAEKRLRAAPFKDFGFVDGHLEQLRRAGLPA